MAKRSPAAGWRLRDGVKRAQRDEHRLRLAELAPRCTFDADSHTYAVDGVPLVSVTQVLTEERFIDFSGVPDRILTAAQGRGTYVHTVLHYYLDGDFDLDDCEPSYRGYVDSALRYLALVNKRPVQTVDGRAQSAEFRFWHVERKFAGTVDYVGFDGDGVLSIDDWKTGEPSDVAAPLQTAAYELGVRTYLQPLLEPSYIGQIKRRAVKLYRDGSPGRPEPYDDPRDLNQFFAALSCVHYRRNGMRHP